MRKYVIAIALAAAFYIDTVLFGVCGSPVFWPNTVLAVIAALSVMGGAAPFAAVGIGIGFIIDVVYNKYIGLTSLSLLIAALAGGAFYNKFYADNVIVPAGVAAACGRFERRWQRGLVHCPGRYCPCGRAAGWLTAGRRAAPVRRAPCVS